MSSRPAAEVSWTVGGARLLSDAEVRHPQDARIEELMDRAVEIRYPNQPAKRSSGG